MDRILYKQTYKPNNKDKHSYGNTKIISIVNGKCKSSVPDKKFQQSQHQYRYNLKDRSSEKYTWIYVPEYLHHLRGLTTFK